MEDWTLEQRKKVSGCILKHKGKYPGFTHQEPESIEDKIVYDADQIDKFGRVSFMQMIKVYVEYGLIVGNERYKTLAGLAGAMTHLAGITLYTETGKRLAAERRSVDVMEISRELTEDLFFYEHWKEQF